MVPAFLSGSLALLHLALFLSYPKARENLFYALTMIAFAGIMTSDLALEQGDDITFVVVHATG